MNSTKNFIVRFIREVAIPIHTIGILLVIGITWVIGNSIIYTSLLFMITMSIVFLLLLGCSLINLKIVLSRFHNQVLSRPSTGLYLELLLEQLHEKLHKKD